MCIHEEDAGILFKHLDFRDDSFTVTRARRLIVQQIFTPANYEYVVQWIFHQDGTVQFEVRLTGILNTYTLGEGEDPTPWGTCVYPGVNAHNHQHLFCLRVDPMVDGVNNSVNMVDAVASDAPVGSEENPHGNAFYAKKTKLDTTGKAVTDYNGATSRTWEIVNESSIHPYSKKPASYKLVSREVPGLLPKEGSLVWKRAAFARHAVHVTKCKPKSSATFFGLLTLQRPRRSDLARRPTCPSNLWRAISWHHRVDRRRHRVHRQHRYRPLAHIWRHTHSEPRRFSCHARRAYYIVAAASQLLPQ